MIHQNGRKCTAVLLALSMILSMAFTVALASPVPPFTVGDGTPTHPYEVSTQEQLSSINDDAYLSSCFLQVAEITITSSNWTPIGNASHKFTGSYNGGGYKIKGLRISITTPVEASAMLGLFGVVGAGGSLSDIHLEDVDIDFAAGPGPFESFVGGLAGESLGTIEDCSVTGTMNVTAYDIAAGGLVGSVGGSQHIGSGAGSVTDCTSACTLNIACTYQTAHAGGLVGEVFTAGSSINNSISSGTVICRGGSDVNQTGPYAGGLIGYASNTGINNCRSDSVVSAVNARSQAIAGGLIGGIVGNCSISNCSSTGNATASDASGSTGTRVCAGGLIGYSFSSSVITDCHSSGDATATGIGASTPAGAYSAVYSGGLLGFISMGTNAVSISQCYALGNATATVTTYGYAFAGGFGGSYKKANISKSYSLGNAQAVAANGYANAGGFAGYLGTNASSLCTLANCFSKGNAVANCASSERVGGLIGVVENSAVSYCYSTGIPSESHAMFIPQSGGLAGVINTGTIGNSYYDSTLSGKTDSDRGTPKLSADMKIPDFETSLTNAGADWKLVSNLNGGYPVLNGIGLGAEPKTVVTYKDSTDTSTVYGTDTVAQGFVFSQPSWVNPAKAGSTLSGWYTDPSCGISYKWNFATQTVSGATHTLFAGWEALDATAPTLMAGSVNRLSDTSATVSFTSGEAGTFYYNVVEDGEAEPVIDTTGTGNSCTASETTIGLALTAGAKDIYIKVKDAAGNVSTALLLDIAAYMAPDTVTPILTAGAVNRLSDTSVTAAFTSDEAGTYYYSVVEDGISEPVIDTDAAGTVCGTSENVISITTLSAGAKDIYIKVKDAAGNVSTALKMDIPDAYVPVTGIEDVPASAAVAVDLVLTGTVIPAEATNQAIVWSLINAGTTGAVLNGSTLSTLSEGTVTVKATVEHGTLPTADYTQEFNIPVYIMSHNTLQEQVETTTVIAEGLIADTAQLIVLPIADGDSDRVELEDQLTEQSAIAAYEVHMVPAEAFRPPLTLTFQVGEIYNGRTVYILHQLANGTTDVYTPTVHNGEAVITVYELSPFLLAVDPQVSIIKQPQSVLTLAGQTATFQVEAEGLDPLSYQWQRRTGDNAAWEDISGATGAGYTTAKVNKSHDGYQYRVIVRDVLGNSATSNTAVLTVTVSPATGDESQPLVFIVMTVLFAAAVILMLRKRRMA